MRAHSSCDRRSDAGLLQFLQSRCVDVEWSIACSSIVRYRIRSAIRRASALPPPPRPLPVPRCCARRRRAAGPAGLPRRSCRAARPRASRSHPHRSLPSAWLSRDRREVAVAHLDRHGARDEAALAASHVGVVARHVGDLLAHPIEIASGRARRCTSLDDDFDGRFGSTGRSSSPCASLSSQSGHAADGGAQHRRIGGAHVDERVDAALAQPLRRDRPDAPERIDRQLLQERLDALGRDHGQAVRLLPRRRDLRQELVRRHAGRRGQASSPRESAP